MYLKHLSIALQSVLAVVLTVFTVYAFKTNHVGQNIVNISAILIFLLRIQNIFIFYRIYINQSFLENIATFLLFLSLSLGALLEKHHPTTNAQYHGFNKSCFILVLTLVSLNAAYYVLVFLALYFHAVRQIYKLARGTILSSSTTLLEQQLFLLRNSYKPYQQLSERNPLISEQCTICLSQFQDEQICIVLPGCDHCFHKQCIDDWLNSKSNCPNCRSNIRLGLLRNDY